MSEARSSKTVAEEAHEHYQPQIEELITENNRLRATIIRARAAMHSATVFVTSRERIKRPGGEQWWRDELAAVDAAWDGIPDETEKSDG